MQSILVLYRSRPRRGSRRGGWRWRLFDRRNHRILGASSEAYRDRADAIANIERVLGIRVGRLGVADFFALPFSEHDRPTFPAFVTYRSLEAARLGYPRMRVRHD